MLDCGYSSGANNDGSSANSCEGSDIACSDSICNDDTSERHICGEAGNRGQSGKDTTLASTAKTNKNSPCACASLVEMLKVS